MRETGGFGQSVSVDLIAGESMDKRVIHSTLGSQNEDDKKKGYGTLSTIKGGEVEPPTEVTITATSPGRRINAKIKTRQRTKNRKSTGFPDRNANLSHSVKFGKFNAQLTAHSHAQQIKSSIQSKGSIEPSLVAPNLLGRGAEQFFRQS